MTYAVIDNGAVVSTAEEMPNGDFKITIEGKDYITSNLELWAVECGYTLFDVEDMEINIHPMYTGYHTLKNPGQDWPARPEDGADLDTFEINPPPDGPLVTSADDEVILGFDPGRDGGYTLAIFSDGGDRNRVNVHWTYHGPRDSQEFKVTLHPWGRV